VTCALRGTQEKTDNPMEFGLDRLKDSFTKASQIAQSTKSKFFVVGGLCDIPIEFAQAFPSLRVLVPSSCSLFIDDYPQSIFGDHTAAQNISNKVLQARVNALVGAKHDLFKASDYFPDNHHLGRQAYYKLFRMLSPYV
jgi:hypothetical protein